MNKSCTDMPDWFRQYGGSAADSHWARAREGLLTGGVEFVSAAHALLHGCSAVAALCGDKEQISEKVEYYKEYFEFAEEQAGISLVRLFPFAAGLTDESRDAMTGDFDRHFDDQEQLLPGVIAKRVEFKSETAGDLPQPPKGAGFVLFKHSTLFSALVHWQEAGELHWLLLSDTLLVTLLIDYWGRMLEEAIEEDPAHEEQLIAFARTFGVSFPA